MANDEDIVPVAPTAADAIKGGIFFGSNLTPAGSFSNIPQTVVVSPPTTTQQASITLTLGQLKDALQASAQAENNTSSTALSSSGLDTLSATAAVELLIDYRDIRNFVFFGSAYTELAFNVNYLIANYPYQAFAAHLATGPAIEINTLSGGYTEVIFENNDLLFPATYSYQENNETNWPGDSSVPNSGFDIVDSLNNRFPIVSFHADAGISVIAATNATPIVITTASPHGFYLAAIASASNTTPIIINSPAHGLVSGTQIIISGVTGNTAANGTFYINVVDANNYSLFQDPGLTLAIAGNGTYITGGLVQLPLQVQVYDAVGNTAANGTFYGAVLSTSTVALYTNSALTIGVVGNGNFQIGNGTRIRAVPLTYTTPYSIRYKIQGNLSVNNLIPYTDSSSVNWLGILVSPKLPAITDFTLNISSVQTQLLALFPVNPTPWPREPITNNIIISGNEFSNWTQSDNMEFVLDPNNPEDELISTAFPTSGGTLPIEPLTLNRAASLDETTTNQLVRRVIPFRIIDETNDTPEGYFQRFILIAGQGFDMIQSYITFLQYTKTLNYTPYNQLSPQYYKMYADHFGFNLFDDQSIDLATLIVRTEPGLSYDAENNPIYDNQATAQTLQQLQYEQQKRLLLNLFAIYRAKGTQVAINYLTSLLGAPEGLFVMREYAFQVNNLDPLGYSLSYFNSSIPYTGVKIVDNVKVHVPSEIWEIDPNYLVNPLSVSDPVNLPYKYRLRLSNYETHNLRELSIYTDPQNAIADQVLGFGGVNYTYGSFGDGSYANLQNRVNPYYLMPLTFPDKYYGVAVDYMIPRYGYEFGDTPDAEDASNIHLASLFNVGALPIQPTLSVSIAQSSPAVGGSPIVVTTSTGPGAIIIITNATNATPIVITSVNHGLTTGANIDINNISGNFAANGSFYINVIDANTFSLFLDSALTIPTIGTGAYTGGGVGQLVVAAAPHGYSSGDRVTIAGVNGNTAANGTFSIIVTSATQFQLAGTIGTGAYANGGTVRRLTPSLHAPTEEYTYPGTVQLFSVAQFVLSLSNIFPEVVINAQNTTPIIINSVGHGFISQDRVRISGVVGNTAANGTFYVNVIDANQFSLFQDSALTIPIAGSGTYVSGGLIVRISTIDIRIENYPNSGLNSTLLLASVPATDIETTAFEISNYINFKGTYPEFTAETINNNDGTFTVQISSTINSQTMNNGKNLYVVNSNLYSLVGPTDGQKQLQNVEGISISSTAAALALTPPLTDFAIDNFRGGQTPVSTSPFIINKLEGKDLVIRIGFDSEVNRNIYSIQSIMLSTPNEVVTTTPHGLTTNDRVTLKGIPTSSLYPNVNGTYTITVVDDVTFILNNTIGTYITPPTSAIGTFHALSTTVVNDGDVFEIAGVQFVGRTAPALSTEFQAGLLSIALPALSTAVNSHPISSQFVTAKAYNAGINWYEQYVAKVSVTIPIDNATNASPVVITTPYAYNFVSGQQVQIVNVGGGTVPDGIYYVQTLTSTTFALYHNFILTTPVIGSGTFTSGGQIQFSSGGNGNNINFAVPAAPPYIIVSVLSSNVFTTTGNSVQPIVITTTTPHALVDFQLVEVSGVLGNTAANGIFYVKVLSPTTFALYEDSVLSIAITGNGNYISGGIVRPLTANLMGGANGTSIVLFGSGTVAIPFEERVAIAQNFFVADGLNHQLRAIYRARGVELYFDYKFVTLLPWLDPTTAVNGPYASLDIPKDQILTCTPLLFPILEYAGYPDRIQNVPAYGDEPRLWDLFIGMPKSIDFNFLRVSVIDTQTIDLPDAIDTGTNPTTGYEAEVYSWAFNSQTPPATSFDISAVFLRPSPGVPGFSEDTYLPVGQNDIITALALHDHEVTDGGVALTLALQDYYVIPPTETLSVDTLFKYNAWSKTLHSNYNYNIAFGEAFDNYQLFSEKVLTYVDLLPYLEVVEQKFKKLIAQFIPIVINLSNFGRIITPNPFNPPKVHYAAIRDICEATTNTNLAQGYFTVATGNYLPGVNKITSVNMDATVLASNINFTSTKIVLGQDVANAINAASPYTISGKQVNVTATNNSGTVIIEVDPIEYLAATGNDINTVALTVTTGGSVTVANITGFEDGQIGTTGCPGGCFVVTRTSLPITIPPDENWIYYDSEHGPITYVYFDSEGNPPLYTYFDSEGV